MKCVLVPTNESTMHSTSHRFPSGNVQHPHTCFHQTIMRDSLSNLMSNTWIAPRFSYSSSPFCMTSSITRGSSLQWRHNEPDGISNHQHRDCLLNRLFRRRSKKTSNPRVTGFCEGNSPVTGEFPSQRAGNAENVSIWWRHHNTESLLAREPWNSVSLLLLAKHRYVLGHLQMQRRPAFGYIIKTDTWGI